MPESIDFGRVLFWAGAALAYLAVPFLPMMRGHRSAALRVLVVCYVAGWEAMLASYIFFHYPKAETWLEVYTGAAIFSGIATLVFGGCFAFNVPKPKNKADDCQSIG